VKFVIPAQRISEIRHSGATNGAGVLNNGRVVYFHSTGRQKEFHVQFSAILKSAEATETI